jgi:hypothetical protein
MFKAFGFCIPTRGTKVPSDPDWLHEIKYDGYRLCVERDDDRVRPITRGGYDWTRRFTWREVASRGDPRELKRAEAALARYGRLIDLPDHRIVAAKQARGREADIVIVDRFSGIFSDDDLAAAMSRARRKPIVVSSQQTP